MTEEEFIAFLASFVANLPKEVSIATAAVQTLATAYATIKDALSANTQAKAEALLAQVNAQTDADIAKLDADATAAGAT